MKPELVRVNDLFVYYHIQQQLLNRIQSKESLKVRAVDGISFSIRKGQIVALVGESGCGKTTVAKTMMGLIKPTKGEIHYSFESANFVINSEQVVKDVREHVQYIFQDPYSSLNPRMTIKKILERPLICFKRHDNERDKRLSELINMVGLSNDHLNRYPHEFSGGQKQRISIARALASDPECIIADEPTAALDVSIQGQVLNLLMELKNDLDLTILLVTHDLGIVQQISDRIIVMYLGKIMEEGKSQEVFSKPLHPYTMALMGAIPSGTFMKKKERIRLKGSIPSPINPPIGCRLHERCPFAMDICSKIEPPVKVLPEIRSVCCHLISG